MAEQLCNAGSGGEAAPGGSGSCNDVGTDEPGIPIALLPTDAQIPAGTDSAKLREGYATGTALVPTAGVEMNLPFQGWYEEIDQEG